MKPAATRLTYLACFILGAAALQACAPLTAGTNTTATCVAAVVGNSTAVGLGDLSASIPNKFVSVTTNQLAQSFLANSAASIATVSLNLDIVASNPPNYVSGTVNVSLEADSVVSLSSPTPNSPNGVVLASAQAATSAMNLQSVGPSYVAFTFTTPISLTSGQIYWIVASPGYSVSATDYVEWRAASTSSAVSIADYFSSSWISFGTGLNFDYRIGC